MPVCNDVAPATLRLIQGTLGGKRALVAGVRILEAKDAQIQALQKENALLQAGLAQQKTAASRPADATARAQMEKDLADMLRTELQQRVPQALKDEEGPWKLVAYIDEIQPPIAYENLRYPSFSMSLLMNEIVKSRPADSGTAVAWTAEPTSTSFDPFGTITLNGVFVG